MILFCIATGATATSPVDTIAANTYNYTARLASAGSIQGTFKAGSIYWSCRGNTCTASVPSSKLDVGDCSALAKRVGAITYFGHKTNRLSTGDLKRCNVSVAKAASTLPTPKTAEKSQTAPTTSPSKPIPGNIADKAGQTASKTSSGASRNSLEVVINPVAATRLDPMKLSTDQMAKESRLPTSREQTPGSATKGGSSLVQAPRMSALQPPTPALATSMINPDLATTLKPLGPPHGNTGSEKPGSTTDTGPVQTLSLPRGPDTPAPKPLSATPLRNPNGGTTSLPTIAARDSSGKLQPVPPATGSKTGQTKTPRDNPKSGPVPAPGSVVGPMSHLSLPETSPEKVPAHKDTTVLQQQQDFLRGRSGAAKGNALDLSTIKPLSTTPSNTAAIRNDSGGLAISHGTTISAVTGRVTPVSVLITAQVAGLRTDAFAAGDPGRYRGGDGNVYTGDRTGSWFQCIGTTCQSTVRMRFLIDDMMEQCIAVAAIAGPVMHIVFAPGSGTSQREFIASELSRCNARVPPNPPTARSTETVLSLHAEASPASEDIRRKLESVQQVVERTQAADWRCSSTSGAGNNNVACEASYRGPLDHMVTICGQIAVAAGPVQRFRWTERGRTFGIHLSPSELGICNSNADRQRRSTGLVANAARDFIARQNNPEAKGERVFQQACAECHRPGNRQGPDLLSYRVLDQCYGTVDPNYRYSRALVNRGMQFPRFDPDAGPPPPTLPEIRKWTRSSLQTMISAPGSVAPGTTMAAVNIDASSRDAVVAYLAESGAHRSPPADGLCGVDTLHAGETWISRGQAIYQAKCVSCHTGTGGPNIETRGVRGKRAGTVDACFSGYSVNLRSASIIWDRGNLDRWLGDPSTVIANTSMPRISLDPTTSERYALVEYMLSIPVRNTIQNCTLAASNTIGVLAQGDTPTGLDNRAIQTIQSLDPAQASSTGPQNTGSQIGFNTGTATSLQQIFPDAGTTSADSVDAQSRADLIRRGEQVFNEKCSNCHGSRSTVLPRIALCGVANVRVGEVGGPYEASAALRNMGGVWHRERLHNTLGGTRVYIGRMPVPVLAHASDARALTEYLMSIPVVSARDPSNRDCFNWNLVRDQ